MADKALALILVFRGEETDILHTLSSQEQADYNLQPASEALGIDVWSDPLGTCVPLSAKKAKNRTKFLKEIKADVSRLASLAYSTTPENVMENIVVQGFLDIFRDHETRQAWILYRLDKLMYALEALARGLLEAAK